MQYQISKLKTKCENILKQNISFDSVVKFLQLAEINNAEILKTKCIEYIRLVSKKIQNSIIDLNINFRECPRIQNTDEYFNLMSENPSLMVHFVDVES